MLSVDVSHERLLGFPSDGHCDVSGKTLHSLRAPLDWGLNVAISIILNTSAKLRIAKKPKILLVPPMTTLRVGRGATHLLAKLPLWVNEPTASSHFPQLSSVD